MYVHEEFRSGLDRRKWVVTLAKESRSDPERIRAERRQILKLLGLGAVAVTASCSTLRPLASVSAEPSSKADSSAPGYPDPRPLEILRKPIELSSGDVLADRRFIVAPDFAWKPSMAAIYCKGSGIQIRNIELVGSARWEHRWDRYNEPDNGPPGIPSGCAGIRLQEVPGAKIVDVSVRGFPAPGITAFGIDEALIQGVKVSDCFHGVVTEWYRPNHRVEVDGVHASNLWGPAPGKWPGLGGPRSLQRSDGYMGGDGLVLASLRDSEVRNCVVTGEQFASLKLVNPQRVQVERIRGIGIMVQGTTDLEWKIDRSPARDVSISSCTIDKTLGTGPVVDEGNALQVSWNVENILVRDCVIRAGGHNGHAIEFVKNVHGRVERCTIEGFNGKRYINPAFALSVTEDSSANPDFERVNTFVNQLRIVDRRS